MAKIEVGDLLKELVEDNPFAGPRIDNYEKQRGRDRTGMDWKAVENLYTVAKGKYKDYYIGRVVDPDDCAQFGKTMGHCAGTHFIWVNEEQIWYFFGLFSPDGIPHVTVHAKQKKWLNKPHPRDTAKELPRDPKYRGYGGIPASDGGYPSFKDVLAHCAKIGVEYVPGEFRPVQYLSRTYDSGATNGYYNEERNWANMYGGYVIRRKPTELSQESWDAYQKVIKVMATEYDKAVGKPIKLSGRTFKFDGKELIILSCTPKGGWDVSAEYKAIVNDWLIDLNKRKKAEKEEVAA
ncbi:MAG TPA: hypothetical protein VIY48_10495 [Candidatus Paceibacterota bacterium]